MQKVTREFFVCSLFLLCKAWSSLLIAIFLDVSSIIFKNLDFFYFVNNLVTKVVFNGNNKCL